MGESARLDFDRWACRGVAFFVDPFPNVVLIHFECVGNMANDVRYHDSLFLVAPFSRIKMRLNFSVVFKDDNQW